MLSELSGKKVLLITSAGGHLAELLAIAQTAGASDTSLWVVPRTRQSESLLEGTRKVFVPYVGPRGAIAALRASLAVARILRTEKFDFCVSTGAAIAAFALPLAAFRGTPAVYIESLARVYGPSLTARILHLVPKVQTHTQSPVWASTHWPYAGTVLDDFFTERRPHPGNDLKVFVTLGTIRPYRFDRAVDAILRLLHPEDSVVWQLGSTERNDLPGVVHHEMSTEAILNEMSKADVVITHAGVGSILDALASGKYPTMLVRKKARLEHVDDHQSQLVTMLQQRGLAAELDLVTPQRSTLVDAARQRVTRRTPVNNP